MKYYRNLNRDENYRDYMMALELDDETIVKCLTKSDIDKCCNNIPEGQFITINEIAFIKRWVTSVYFGDSWNLNYIPNYFCFNFPNLIHLDPLPDMITSIGDSFIQSCTSFNQPLTLPSSLTSIGDYFMHVCTSFNQPLILPESITSIGLYFMSNCQSFNQPLTLPNSITSIGIQFMRDCRNFTGPLDILFTDPNVFAGDDYSLSTNYTTYPIYSTGITITGNMTGAQLRTRLPNRTSSPFRKILG